MHINAQKRFPPLTVQLRNKCTVTLRFLEIEDRKAFGDFYLSIERAAYRFYCPHPLTRENAEKITEAALSPDVVGLVAIDDSQHIVAYVSYHCNASDHSPSIFGICIRKPYRGVGLGEILVGRLAEIAQNIGPSVMSLTVQKANLSAVALYQKMGFEIKREQIRQPFEEFSQEPEFYMERIVRQNAQ